ncbi:MAG: hypothetical protein IJO08_03105 [Clostridia bacterium]|nr:hypothetical protein [Clostridia bacterium]
MLNENIRIDLHIHSAASEYKEEENYVSESNVENVDVLLGKLQENNINMFAITDHNNFDFALYEKLKEKINKPPYDNIKNILPGVEFDVQLEESSSVACHIVTIFNDLEIKKVKHIQEKIESVRLLTNPSEFYTIEEFEKILKEIGINVLLIAHQKSGLEVSNSGKSHHSLSEAVENPIEWLKVGYINALEYQKPKVQGILKSDLNDFKMKFSTITGSDCHVWEAYPKKDHAAEKNSNYVTKIKALPTFKGLVFALTSPETRMERKDVTERTDYLNAIKIEGKDFPLSPGINAIIGENGAGKSFLLGLLNGENDKKYAELKKANNIQISKIGEPNIAKISQGQIIEKVKDGTLLNNKGDYYLEIPTINEFKSNISKYVRDLNNYILQNIQNNDDEEKFSRISIKLKEIPNIKNYYISIINDANIIENIPQQRYEKIEEIFSLLSTEYEQNKDFYIEEKEETINTILTSLQDLKKTLHKECEVIEMKNKVINVITSVLNEICVDIDSERTSQEKEKEECVAEIRSFAKEIADYITKEKKVNTYPNFPNKLNGTSMKRNAGFNFIKEAKFHNAELELPLYKELFVQNYQDRVKIKQIKNTEEYIKAVNGVTKKEKLAEQIDANTNKFINEYIKEETRIKPENGTDEVGTTPGEIALTFYQLILSKDMEENVILIDQPEDDISMKRIESYMINYFNNIRDKKQIIFVTHNPLLVVNLDVDNVINISKNKGNVLNVDSGCLESNNMIELVSKNLDGGKEAIERRLKVYGGC